MATRLPGTTAPRYYSTTTLVLTVEAAVLLCLSSLAVALAVVLVFESRLMCVLHDNVSLSHVEQIRQTRSSLNGLDISGQIHCS